MNEMPTSGPMSASITHQARDASSSRHSLASSHANRSTALTAGLGPRKHGLLEIAAQLVDRAFPFDASAAQQHEAIAHAGGVRDLVNRQEQRPPRRRVIAERRADLARLPKVEPVEGLVD